MRDLLRRIGLEFLSEWQRERNARMCWLEKFEESHRALEQAYERIEEQREMLVSLRSIIATQTKYAEERDAHIEVLEEALAEEPEEERWG